MDKKVVKTSIDLTSLVNSHEKPFVVIDKDYRILAVNKAYEHEYGASSEDAVGKMCYQVSHGNDHPCSDEGEECPHDKVFGNGEATVCAHVHCDSEQHMHHVKVSAFPLKGSSDELFLGECIEKISLTDTHLPRGERMVGESSEFLACVNQLNVAASSDAPVLLLGETGTGKELAAKFIHQHSSRSGGPFQIIDSTVFTDSLFESEMFGHASGAYTGSVGEKQGLFELADGGTIFLDEVGDLPASQQAKLLRVLENGEYRRVGGKKSRKTNVRIICATNRHLWESVIAGSFREDLYYRIACLNIRLPSLRDRIDDVPVLANNLLEGINRSMHSSYHLMPDAYEKLQTYNYPGNVRELRNILFIAATRSHNSSMDAALITKVINNLPHCMHPDVTSIDEMSHTSMATSQPPPAGIAEKATLKDLEAQHIKELLGQFHGNRKKAANALGISERTIYRKLKSLGLC
ncbi:MAG: sigma 54-interacting transcriptional regulator [Proteobacteria bacterium]|nr:sigma 54-interacting transcriptional regulator [Pseudomonadota bacterium]